MATTQTELKTNVDSIEDAIEAIRRGEVVIVMDDEDRENEGDFICAAECITPEIVNFMARYGRGLICTPIEETRADELGLELMVNSNTALHETAFTISIDLIGDGCTTGISAHDRFKCIKALTNPDMTAGDFGKPGHIFPLRAKPGGVLKRTGHTEAAVDLARMAGKYPAGVLVEILNEDGSMARMPELQVIAKEHGLKLITIKDLVAFRMKTERIVEKEYEADLETAYGNFKITAFRQTTSNEVHFAIQKGEWTDDENVLVRVHSSSETGDILGSLFDGYGSILQKSMELIAEEGKGLLLYMMHQGASENVLERLKARFQKSEKENEQKKRSYGVGAQILREMNVKKMRLITNSDTKRIGINGYGLEIVETVKVKL